MGRRIGHRGNCCRCLYLTKPLIVCKEEAGIMHQRPSKRSAELVSYEWRDGAATQVKVVPRAERSIPVEFEQRPMEMITSGLGYRLDDATTSPAVLRTVG